MHRQQGQALLMVVMVTFILQIVAAAFLFRMNVEQRFAGGSARNLAALYLAEAGLQKALWMLEEGTSEESTTGDWSLPHQEALGHGTFTIEAMEHRPDGEIAIVVRGEVAGAYRRLKAVGRVGPEALGYGLYGQGFVGFAGQARTYLVPFRSGGGNCQCPGNLAAGSAVLFDGPWVALNAFSGIRLALRDGDIADYGLLGSSAATNPSTGLIDLVLAGGARLMSGMELTPVGLEDLQEQIKALGIRRLRFRPALPAPSIDVNHYRALAEANTANAGINLAAGEIGGQLRLQTKAHSRYSVEEFEAILNYLKLQDQPKPSLRGIVFVEGDVRLDKDAWLTIADGALVVVGDVAIGTGARLEVRHGLTTRWLPGLVAWREGTIQMRGGAVAIIDGLAMVDGDIRVRGGVLDVMGAVAARNFFNRDGTVVVRYDPGVLATVGLRRSGKGLAELVSWQELP